jgi:hypothetical protein
VLKRYSKALKFSQINGKMLRLVQLKVSFYLVVAEIGGTEVAEQRPASMGSDAVMASAAAAKTGTGSRAAHSFGLSNGRVAELDACWGRSGPAASTAHSPIL